VRSLNIGRRPTVVEAQLINRACVMTFEAMRAMSDHIAVTQTKFGWTVVRLLRDVMPHGPLLPAGSQRLSRRSKKS